MGVLPGQDSNRLQQVKQILQITYKASKKDASRFSAAWNGEVAIIDGIVDVANIVGANILCVGVGRVVIDGDNVPGSSDGIDLIGAPKPGLQPVNSTFGCSLTVVD